MKIAALVLAVMLAAQPVSAQAEWPDLDALLSATLADAGSMEASVWLPDSADPDRAGVALAIAYIAFEGGNGVGISAGIFTKSDVGWVLTTPVTDLYGQAPRNHMIGPDTILVTTTMPGPDDPRCCPTVATRWSIDRMTGVARQVE